MAAPWVLLDRRVHKDYKENQERMALPVLQVLEAWKDQRVLLVRREYKERWVRQDRKDPLVLTAAAVR